MKRKTFWMICAMTIFIAVPSKAQSLKDLFSKDNIEKLVSDVTGKSSVNMEGTWTFTGSAIEFESDNILSKAGGEVASAAAESKLNEQLSKLGIKEGILSFTFEADSTFSASLSGKNINGTYAYNESTKQVELKIAKLINLHANVETTQSTMELLFKSDKLLELITFLSSKSDNTTLQAINSLAGNYDGIMLGLALKKKE